MAYEDPSPRTRRATLGLAAVFTAGVIAAGVGLARSATGGSTAPPPVAAAHVAVPPAASPVGHRALHEEVD